MYYSWPFSDSFLGKQGFCVCTLSLSFLFGHLLAPHDNLLVSPPNFNQICRMCIDIKDIWAVSMYVLVGWKTHPAPQHGLPRLLGASEGAWYGAAVTIEGKGRRRTALPCCCWGARCIAHYFCFPQLQLHKLTTAICLTDNHWIWQSHVAKGHHRVHDRQDFSNQVWKHNSQRRYFGAHWLCVCYEERTGRMYNTFLPKKLFRW